MLAAQSERQNQAIVYATGSVLHPFAGVRVRTRAAGFDFARLGSVLLTMDNDTPHNWKTEAFEALLMILAAELETTMDVVTSSTAQERIGELRGHCINASAIAEASHKLLSRPD